VTAGLAVCGAAGVAGDLAHLPSQPGAAATLALLVLGTASVRVAAAFPAGLVAAAGIAVLIAGRVGLRGEYIVAFGFLGVLAWGCALAIGAWMRLLDIRRAQVIDTARRDERLDLARELHDVVAHHVAGIVVQAQAARIIAAKRPETLDATLAGIESAGNDALAAMRRVVSLLRDPADAGGRTPGPEQLSVLVSRFAGHGPAVQLRLPDGDRPPWPPEVAATVYRIVQEALTNVILHAPGAASVTVTVGEDVSGVTVEVTDDAPRRAISGGAWFAPAGGNGLTGMRERAEALGGTLRAGPGPDGGWVVTAELPLAARRIA
jgi:signal transduction histidine kinase